MENITKICCKCELEKNLSEFHKDKYEKDGHTYACKICRNNKYNNYYVKNPEKQKLKNDLQKDNRKAFYSSPKGIISSRRAHLKRNYNMSLEEYEKRLLEQGDKCAICENYHRFDKYGVLAVDHCHKTGKIRGLLCFKCNTILGSVNDNIDTLKKAIKYLKKNE